MSHALSLMPRGVLLGELAKMNDLLDVAEVTVGFGVQIQRLLRMSGAEVSLRSAMRLNRVTRVIVEVPEGADPDEYCAAMEAYTEGLLQAEPAPEKWSTKAVLDARKAALASLRTSWA